MLIGCWPLLALLLKRKIKKSVNSVHKDIDLQQKI